MSRSVVHPMTDVRRALALCALCGVGGMLWLPAWPARAEAEPKSRSEGVLVITLEALPSEGVLHLELHDVDAARTRGRPRWEAPLERRRVPTQAAGALEVRFERLRAGVYAVRAFLDQNGNAELDRGRRGVPQEPFGFSNDVRGRLGPPRLERAAFRYVPPLTHIVIRLSSPPGRAERDAIPPDPPSASDRSQRATDSEGGRAARAP